MLNKSPTPTMQIMAGTPQMKLFTTLLIDSIFRKMLGEVPAVGFVAGIPVAFLYLLNIRPDIIPGLLKVPAGDSVFYISFHTCRIVLMKRDAPDADVVLVPVRSI